MRLPRFRFHIRTLLLIVALVALALVGQRIYRDGPEAHWLVLKLRYGNVETRRAAANEVWHGDHEAIHDAFDYVFGFASPTTLDTQMQRRQRRATLLLPAVARAAKDQDAICRANALGALDRLASFDASEQERSLALRQILEAMGDPEPEVREEAIASMVSLAACDTPAVIRAIRLALADPSAQVRLTATQQLGRLGYVVPLTQLDVASILIPILASREDSRIRVSAAWGLSFGVDDRRYPPDAGPDVVPALLRALKDPDVDVRREAAHMLGLTRPDSEERAISSWARRKDSIIPGLTRTTADPDKETRENAALALFAFGHRDRFVIDLIEQAVLDPSRDYSQKVAFESALNDWRAKR